MFPAARASGAPWLRPAPRAVQLQWQEGVAATALTRRTTVAHSYSTPSAGAAPMHSQGKTDESGACVEVSKLAAFEGVSGMRNVCTSIHWLMTSPVMRWCYNRSDHVHIWNAGGAIRYHVLHPDGRYEQLLCGGEARGEQVLQAISPGGTFTAGELIGDWCLVTESVAPGWDFRDFHFVAHAELAERAPKAELENMSRWVKAAEEPSRRSLADGYPKYSLHEAANAVRAAIRLARALEPASGAGR